jgi:hypothetical protein
MQHNRFKAVYRAALCAALSLSCFAQTEPSDESAESNAPDEVAAQTVALAAPSLSTTSTACCSDVVWWWSWCVGMAGVDFCHALAISNGYDCNACATTQ